jgi:uncharacterized protein (TIGR00106 family)
VAGAAECGTANGGMSRSVCGVGRMILSPRTKGGYAMNVMIDLCVVPLGIGVSLSRYVAACEKVLTEAGLHPQLHAFGTNVEGEWDTVMAAVKRCHEVVHEMGVPRISTTIRLGTRVDRDQTLADKIRAVKEKL